jgi:hypothetical protein
MYSSNIHDDTMSASVTAFTVLLYCVEFLCSLPLQGSQNSMVSSD